MQYKPKDKEHPKDQERRVQKVISGTAKTKKKSEGRKIAEMFISDDVHNVKSFVVMDVIVPAIKDAIYSGITNALHMSLFGGEDRRRRSDGKTKYSGRYESSRDRDRRNSSRSDRIDLDDLTVETRGDAEDVLDQMYFLLDEYGAVSVADYLDMLGVDHDYTYNKYGWTDLRSAEIKRDRSGEYYIRLARPKLI